MRYNKFFLFLLYSFFMLNVVVISSKAGEFREWWLQRHSDYAPFLLEKLEVNRFSDETDYLLRSWTVDQSLSLRIHGDSLVLKYIRGVGPSWKYISKITYGMKTDETFSSNELSVQVNEISIDDEHLLELFAQVCESANEVFSAESSQIIAGGRVHFFDIISVGSISKYDFSTPRYEDNPAEYDLWTFLQKLRRAVVVLNYDEKEWDINGRRSFHELVGIDVSSIDLSQDRAKEILTDSMVRYFEFYLANWKPEGVRVSR